MFRLKQLIGKSRIRLAALLSFLLFIGCQQRLPDAALWEGTIELAEGKLLPFRMHLDLTGKHPSGSFLVGNEKTPIPELHRRGDSLLFLFSEYGAAIRAAWDGKLLQGVYLRFRSDTTALNFRAAAEVSSGQTSHAESSTAPPVGNYQVYLQKADRIDSATVASFWTQGDSIFGTFIAPDGDYGLLAGQRFGNSVQLGRFTGWQAIMLEMNQHFGQWGGKLYSRKDSPQTFILEPRPSLSRESLGERKTAMKNPRSPFVFSGITIQGDTLSHRDPRFAGKALIVDIMGTWCHNCLDEAPLLQQIYDELKHDGLEIVGLSFEIK
ncbi:MAG: TlpA disulfide reductase family protein, partial [Bacteroidota bacterium]